MRGLYAIIDPEHCVGRPLVEVAAEILAGGCAALQLRAKALPDADLQQVALQLRTLTRAAGVPFFINDHVQLALQVGADGVHLGQADMSLGQARATLGHLRIGLSTHDLQQVAAAQLSGADLIGFGPVFDTRTKLQPEPVVGLARLKDAVAHSALPVVAIGGITRQNVASVVATGARLAAVISAVCASDDPRAAARELHHALSSTASP